MQLEQFILSAVLTLSLCTASLGSAASVAERRSGPSTPARDYWPTHNWKSAAPEDHGLDTNSLAKAIQQLPQTCPEVHSFLVVRHGYLVVERYFHGRTEQDPWNIKSASKSILSALVGIALQEGYLRSLDQPVIEFFPQYRDQLGDRRQQEITLRHLLTMTAGLEWVENGPISRRWMASRDWIGFTLKSKRVADPGAEWNYSTAQTHLLSALLTGATGTNTVAFARRALLDPVGVSVNQWDQDPQGVYWGGSEVHLTPRNMAKFGFLYLNNGQWDGKQIVPASWVRASTQQTNSAHYGFLWWLDNFQGHPMYFAQGLGGQHIVVVPDLDVVVVTTSYISAHNSALGFIKLVVLPCIKRFDASQGDLPPAPQIIEKYYQAIGGREQLAKLKSLRTTGTAQVPAMRVAGSFEVLKGGRNSIYSNTRWTQWPSERFGSDGKTVWTTFPHGYRILTGEQARPWRDEAKSWSDLRDPVEEMKTAALTPYNGRPCYLLQSERESGEVVSDFYDAETGLLVASIRPEEQYPDGLHAFTRIFSEYRQFGAFRFPTRIIRQVQGPEVMFTRTAVEYDTVHPRTFDLPIPISAMLQGKGVNQR